MLFILVNVECREKNCSDDYHGESARRISERIIYHGRKDKKIHLFVQVVVNDHRNASYDDFKIIESGFRNNAFKRNVTEALINQGIKINFESSREID